jgi:GNAT superfamily N-acetyltransferase
MSVAFRVSRLTSQTYRDNFHSGSTALDRYFHTQVTQDIKRNITACFIASADDGRVTAYYTLASASILLNDLPPNMTRKLPRHPSVPAVRMGRLAVDQSFQGLGLGAAMLADALQRCASAEIAAYALLVDAKDEQAADFYAHHGFIALPQQTLTLFLPLATVKTLTHS